MFNDVDDKDVDHEDGDDNVGSCNLCSRRPNTWVWGGCWAVPAKNRGVPAGWPPQHCDDDSDGDDDEHNDDRRYVTQVDIKNIFYAKNTISLLIKTQFLEDNVLHLDNSLLMKPYNIDFKLKLLCSIASSSSWDQETSSSHISTLCQGLDLSSFQATWNQL